ncbi:hypothetical protein DNI29_22285 [Hymenobacter sediminis]|uniref:hypothetical protein n=1 Tax=Hymenobacter sediminis TaxID=2218621 RepID=UPI000DA66BB8|nr:hypothetical protein [Hymenobacter sediminis]RPD44129.1 hypothetical protein DNI29_22285 [Hymenobacter sediminis]
MPTISLKDLGVTKINKLQTQAITAHVRNLLANDPDFQESFKKNPIGMLTQFGLSAKLAAGIMAESKAKVVGVGRGEAAAKITDCCCSSSVTVSCGADFWDSLPAINEIEKWQVLSVKNR